MPSAGADVISAGAGTDCRHRWGLRVLAWAGGWSFSSLGKAEEVSALELGLVARYHHRETGTGGGHGRGGCCHRLRSC